MSKQLEYERLLNEHRRVSNEISEIKTESFELDDEQKNRIKKLEMKLVFLMEQMKRLF
jgi:hypothetical protein